MTGKFDAYMEKVRVTAEGTLSATSSKIPAKEQPKISPPPKITFAVPSRGTAEKSAATVVYQRVVRNRPYTPTKGRKHMSVAGSSEGYSGPIPWGRILQGITGLIAVLGGVWWATHDTPPNRAENERIWLIGENQKEVTRQMQIAARSGRPVSMPGGTAAGPSSSGVVVLSTFPCDTVERQSAGYAAGNVQAVFKPDASYRFPQGCALVRIDTYVHSLQAGSYLFSERGVKFGCGNHSASGRNDPPEDCVNFLNRHQGQVLELANGSNLVIN